MTLNATTTITILCDRDHCGEEAVFILPGSARLPDDLYELVNPFLQFTGWTFTDEEGYSCPLDSVQYIAASALPEYLASQERSRNDH